ncbi:MAG: hypothetical protein IJW58_04545 [Clostridia bacterium]|nr:hypothetical protein [Clostridia bacterium]
MSKKEIGTESIQYRIKKNQNRAFFVGLIYWFATLALTVLSVFPYVGQFTGYGTDGRVWIVSCLDPVLALMGGTLTGKVVLHAIVSIVYLLTFVFTVWNFIVTTCKLFRITKKNPTNRHGYNRASAAMRAMSKRYARSFFWAVTSAVAIVLLGDGSFTLFFYIALALGLFFHFLGNLIGCKVSYFKTTDDKFHPEEIKRGFSRKLFALRNVVQFVAIAVIVVLMDRFGLLVGTLFNIVETGAMASIMQNNLLDGLVLPVILFLIMVCLIVCIRHATGITEYNSRGMKGKGMKTCRIFATVIAVLALIGAVVVLLVPEGTIVPKWAFLGIFAIALLWAISEYMVVALLLGEEEKKVVAEGDLDNKKETVEETEETERQEQTEVTQENDVEEVSETSEVVEEVEESNPLDAPKEESEKSLDELLDEVEETLDEVEGEKKSQTEETVDAEEKVDEVETTEEVEEPVVEEEPYDDGLSETERKYRNELKQKWMDMATVEFEEPSYGDDEERDKTVNCPCCQRKLRVKFGTDVAKCPACQNMFVLKIVKSSEEVFPQNVDGKEDLQEQGYDVKDAEAFDEFEEEFEEREFDGYVLDEPFDCGNNEELFKKRYAINAEKKESEYAKEEDENEQYLKEAEQELRKLVYGDDSEIE